MLLFSSPEHALRAIVIFPALMSNYIKTLALVITGEQIQECAFLVICPYHLCHVMT